MIDQPSSSSFAQRLSHVQQRIHNACMRAERTPQDVTLVAVSKKHPTSTIQEAYQAGLHNFGENYVQEWQQKQDELQSYNTLRWHLIGPLQRNKCKFVAGQVDLIHSISKPELITELDRRMPPQRTQRILLQCNLAQESQKSGFLQYENCLEAILQCPPSIQICGLMLIPPFSTKPESNRHLYRELRDWQQRLQQQTTLPLQHLSMGMSHDFEMAIEEGATLIRVGTALFGPRPQAE
ncbi:MAG: YggS family pyridoxal phosphate-dependent enzyme [Myxococcota bacterium]